MPSGQRDLSVSYNKLGDVQRQQGDTAGALAAYEQGLGNRDKLAAANPQDAQGQRDLSISYEKLGDVKRQQGDAAGALAAYESRPCKSAASWPRPTRKMPRRSAICRFRTTSSAK